MLWEVVRISIITLQEALDFLNIGTGYFEITAENDVLNMTSDQGGPVNIDVPDGTYDGDDLATALQTAMNADDTLTGSGTITFAVSYNSTTFKFTIDSGSGHTITIDVSKSDAALTFGFTKDPTAAQSITSDQAATEDPTAIVSTIKNGVEEWVKNYCHRDFESTSYKEYYDGKGEELLYLRQFPVINIARLSIGRNDAIKVNNSSSSTYATVSVTSTAVVLNHDGTETTLSFSSYSTLTDMVNAINAVGDNWSAGLMSTDYASYKSTELIEKFGLHCLDTDYAYLEIPDEPEDDFDIDTESGKIYLPGGFPKGQKNIRVEYTAGYSTMPEDLKMAVKILVKNIYQKRDEETFGLEQYSLGYVRAVLEKQIPSEVRQILWKYRKFEV